MNPHPPAILIIEKDEITLEIYQRELCNSFNVFAFMEINGVIDTLAQQDIQAVVIEPEICAGQGWELIDDIQKTLSGRRPLVIVCSTRDASRKSRGKNIALYLTKPILPRTLREKVLEIIHTKSLPEKP